MVNPPSDAPPSDVVRVALSQAEAAHRAIAYVQQDIDRTERALAIAIKRLREILEKTLPHERGYQLAQAALIEIEAQDQPTEPPA